MKPLSILLFAICIFTSSSIFAQPANNDCANAISVNLGTDQPFTTVGATTDGPEHPTALCYGNGGDFCEKEVWYTITAQSTGHMELSLCGTTSFDTRIAAYVPGSSCPPVDEDLLACNDDGENCPSFSSKMSFPCVAGETYLFCIGGYAFDEIGTGTFSLQEIAAPTYPDNNMCADSETILVVSSSQASNEEGKIYGTTLNAPSAFGGPSCNATGEYNDVWYNFNTGDNDAIQVTTEILTNNAKFHMELWESDCNNPVSNTNMISCWGVNEVTNGFTMIDLPDAPTDYALRVATRITDQAAGDFSIQMVGDAISSIDKTKKDDNLIMIYPNPSNGSFFIKVTDDVIQNNLEIKDLQGRIVYAKAITLVHNNQLEINLNSLNPGIYLVDVIDQDGQIRSSKKLLIE